MLSSRCLAILAAFALAFVVGCHKDQSTSSPSPGPGPRPGPPGGPEPSGPHAEGMKVFNRYCTNCHIVPGSPPGGQKKRGPDLSKVAADPEHTEEWLRDFILEPASKKPDSKGMPMFRGKVNDDEMKSLVAYLASLK